MSKLKMTCRLLLFASVLLLPIPALALPQFSIAGDGTYVLKGTQFQGVTGVQVYISYDSGLTNPRVDLGGLMKGLLSAENHSGNPIVINGVTTSVINGSGTIATITFDKTGNGVGSVNVWGFVIGPTGQKLTMAAPSVSNPIPPIASTDPSADNGGGGNNGNGGSNGGGGNNGNPGGNGNTDNGGGYRQPFVAGGTLTFPPADAGGKDTTKETAKDTAAPATEPEPQQSAAAESPAPAVAEAKTPDAPAPKGPEQVVAGTLIPSVLDRFRVFDGEKNIKNLTTLFALHDSASFTQSPAIGISDGKSSVKVTISKVAGEKAPNFTFSAAHFVSLSRVGEGQWEIETRPDKGAVAASIIVLANGVAQEFPLTVAPKVALPGNSAGPTDADFLLFLKERGTPAAPKYDLNGDGKRDYVDDYIFTANYLMKIEEDASKKKQTAQKKQ